jgi:transketolase
LDYNHLQIEGNVNEINDPEPIKDKFIAFKWVVREVDGHNLEELYESLNWCKEQDRPQLVIAHTVKGKGVSFMENDYKWHSAILTEDLYRKAMEELS